MEAVAPQQMLSQSCAVTSRDEPKKGVKKNQDTFLSLLSCKVALPPAKSTGSSEDGQVHLLFAQNYLVYCH